MDAERTNGKGFYALSPLPFRVQCDSMKILNRAGRGGLVGLVLAGLLVALPGCLETQTNRPPTAVLSAEPTEGYAPLSVLLDASDSYDPDGDPLAYEWTLSGVALATGRAITHEFPDGTHHVRLRVVDREGETDSQAITITARPVPEGYVVRNYEWTHDGDALTWAALIPYDLYQTYRGRLRTPFVDNYDYPAFVLDPLDDPTLEEYAIVLWNQVGGHRDAFIERTLAFVQGAIAYEADPTGQEWPLYPIETMYDAAGDCEDTTILYVSLLRAKGIPSKIGYVDTDDDNMPDHVLALVPVTADHAARLTCGRNGATGLMVIDGLLHALAETAVVSGEVGLGCDPWGLEAEDVLEAWEF